MPSTSPANARWNLEKLESAWKIPFVPATFMSAVSCTYILQAPEGLQLSTSISYPVGILFAIVCVALYYKTTMGSKS